MRVVAYCGLDCEKCVKFKGVYADKARELLEAIEESGLDEWQEHEPREEEFNYNDFKKGLVWFEKHMRCVGCLAGGGNPDCVIKKCCKERGINNCSECLEFPCDKIQKFKEDTGIDVEKNFKEIK